MSFIKDESGATAVKYGLLAGFWFGLTMIAYVYVYTSIGASMQALSNALGLS
jgi:Flp pilus assembly pilin Flp